MKVTGKTSLINHQSLTFAQVGKVTKVYVKEGDKVKMGQLLAEIDKTDIMLNIAQQRIAVGNAQLQYNKLINSSTTNAIQQQSNRDDADRRLTSARQNLIDITNEMDRKLQDQQDTISELQQQLTILQASDSSSVQTYSTVAASASTDAMNTIATIGDAIASMDAILHTNRPGDQSLIYLGAKNPSSLSNAQGDIERLRSTFSTFQTAYQTFNAASAKTLDVILALQNANKDLNTIFATTTQDMLVMINASIPDATYLPDSTISSYRSTISSLNSKAISSVASITTAIQTSQNSVSDITKVQNNLASAQRTLIQLQQDYTSKIQQAKDTIASDESALAVAQATLDSNVNGANANDIALQRNSIANASISLQKLQNQLKDYELRAVFDGTVSDVGFVVGDTPSTNKSTTDKALTISNPNLYEIDMMIDQIDIVNIREGQQVNYTFDAYPNKVFTGVISAVVSTPVTDQGVTSFTVKVIGEK